MVSELHFPQKHRSSFEQCIIQRLYLQENNVQMSEKMADDVVSDIKGMTFIIGVIWLVKRFFGDRSIEVRFKILELGLRSMWFPAVPISVSSLGAGKSAGSWATLGARSTVGVGLTFITLRLFTCNGGIHRGAFVHGMRSGSRSLAARSSPGPFFVTETSPARSAFFIGRLGPTCYRTSLRGHHTQRPGGA